MSSAAESISAWMVVLAWPSMVAAFSFALHGPAMREAAFSQMFNLLTKRNYFRGDKLKNKKTQETFYIPFGYGYLVPFLLSFAGRFNCFVN